VPAADSAVQRPVITWEPVTLAELTEFSIEEFELDSNKLRVAYHEDGMVQVETEPSGNVVVRATNFDGGEPLTTYFDYQRNTVQVTYKDIARTEPLPGNLKRTETRRLSRNQYRSWLYATERLESRAAAAPPTGFCNDFIACQPLVTACRNSCGGGAFTICITDPVYCLPVWFYCECLII